MVCGLIASVFPLAAADPVPGPLHSLNVYFPYLFFVQSSGAYAQSQPAGTLAATITESYGNTFLIGTSQTNGFDNPFLLIDGEAAYTEFALSWTPITGTTVGLRALHVVHCGGFLDPIVHTFHELFGFRTGAREERPEGEVVFFVRPEPTDTFRWSGPIAGLQSLTADAVHTLIPHADGPLPALSSEISVKLPLVWSGFRASGVDAMARLLARWYLGAADRVAIDASVGAAYLTRPQVVPEQWFDPWVLPAGLSVAWRALPRLTPTVSISGTTSPYSVDTELLDRFSAHAVIGASFELREHLQLQAGFAEEFLTFATADISFHASLQYRVSRQSNPRPRLRRRAPKTVK